MKFSALDAEINIISSAYKGSLESVIADLAKHKI
jgi:hypothetical protein